MPRTGRWKGRGWCQRQSCRKVSPKCVRKIEADVGTCSRGEDAVRGECVMLDREMRGWDGSEHGSGKRAHARKVVLGRCARIRWTRAQAARRFPVAHTDLGQGAYRSSVGLFNGSVSETQRGEGTQACRPQCRCRQDGGWRWSFKREQFEVARPAAVVYVTEGALRLGTAWPLGRRRKGWWGCTISYSRPLSHG